MNDADLFDLINKEAAAGNVRVTSYQVIPRGLHKFTVTSSAIDKKDDGARMIEIIGEITDSSPENGMQFRISGMLITKDGKKIATTVAIAAGLVVAAKAQNINLNANFTGSAGVTGEGWFDAESYTKNGKTYFNQAFFWGTEEPPKTQKKAESTTTASSDAPF